MSATSIRQVPAAPGRRWLWPLVAAAAAVAVYLNAVHNPFVYDDHRLILENPALTDWPNLWAVVARDMTRPLTALSYAFDRVVWGLDPFGYHVTNVALHALNVALVFFVVDGLAGDAVRARRVPDTTSAWTIAATASLVFAINPMMTQAVGYISGRSELLCAAFLLLAMLAIRRHALTGQVRWLAGAWAAWLLAISSKEVAAVFPLVALAAEYAAGRPPDRHFGGRVARVYAPMCALTLAAAAARIYVLQAFEYADAPVDPTFVLVQLEAVRRYAWLLLGQGPQSIFHHVAPYDDLISLRTLGAAATLPLLVGLVLALTRTQRLAALGIWWFLLCLVPSSALFVLGRGEAMAEHRAYVAGIGFFIALGVAVERLAYLLRQQPARTWRLGAFVGGMLVAQLAMHTVLRNMTWSNPLTLWTDAVNRAPGHWLPHLMLGEALREGGMCTEAVPEYRRAIAGNPDESTAYAHLGSCLLAMNDTAQATEVFAALERRHPASSDAAVGLALVAVARDRLDEAEQLLVESIRRDGNSQPARRLLASLEGRHDPAQSRAFCAEVRAVAPASRAATSCAESLREDRP